MVTPNQDKLKEEIYMYVCMHAYTYIHFLFEIMCTDKNLNGVCTLKLVRTEVIAEKCRDRRKALLVLQ